MECPTCEKVLSTERGMRQHHTKVHGVSLPNRKCSGCGTEFYDPKARLEYCDDCNPNAGEHNGNWQDATERAACARCGDAFEYYPSDKDGVYCPTCVDESDEFLGDASWEVWDVQRVDRNCDECGVEMTVLKSDRERSVGRFCSRDCLSAWMSTDEEWDPSDYSGSWYPVKRAALERDDHECQSCGRTRTDMGREPDVHHIVPVREFDDPQDAHTIENVICLCRSCHRLAEIGRIPTPVP
ncbi:HNH endonuclease [Haloarchaeobius iranensis]|uniref:HNH endonuclease n=1 Tax=Haloarchaeobius iranensis TaxID=996166 RepID=A0A1G9T4Q1_9EURY|nr:HNH endonuclease signature motif containing protein [Haloarchaeobius iranensis]SDM42734.1 HNH endonuclease [Haloarchaeobius iranensis]